MWGCGIVARNVSATRGGRSLGDHSGLHDERFHLMMTTKLPNPHYLPDLQVKVTLLNFSVTPKGLEDQLLSDVVRFEKAELEEKANSLVIQLA